MDIEYCEQDGGPVLALVAPDGRRLAGDMAEMEPMAWAALADMLSPTRVRAAALGRSTGLPAVVLANCLASLGKRATFMEPRCPQLARIQRDWGLDVQPGAPSAPRFLDVCCLDVAGMEDAQAREAVRQAEAAVLPEGWLVVRGADAELLQPCVPPELRAVRLDRPYGHRVSVFHRDPEVLQAFGDRLATLLRLAAGEE